MNNSMRQRLAALEAKIGSSPLILHMADGSERIIDGRQPHYCQLWNHVTEVWQAEDANDVPPASPRLDAELAWLKTCIQINGESGRFGLMRVLLLGPNTSEENDIESTEDFIEDGGRQHHPNLRLIGQVNQVE